MSYRQRVKIITPLTTPGYLGEEIVEKKEVIVPCTQAALSMNEQMGVFGKYNQAAFKLHIQGIHKGFSVIEYEGVERSVHLTKWHHHSTVVILT